MNVQKTTPAMVLALAYEIALKAVYFVVPSLPTNPIISKLTPILSLAVGVTIVLFLFAFRAEERKNKFVAQVSTCLIGLLLLKFVFRVSVWSTLVGFEWIRLVHEALGFAIAVFLFLLVIGYKPLIPEGERHMKRAAILVAVMCATGILKSALSLAAYARFMGTGLTAEFPPVFYESVAGLFFLTHASIIYFLYCYYKMKAGKSEKGGSPPEDAHDVICDSQWKGLRMLHT